MSTNAERQFIWGLRYIDELILRDRDTMGTGILDETFYLLQDANWNLTASAGASGTIQERYAYDGYGASIVLTPLFGSRTESDFGWETRFAGYRFDSLIAAYHIRNRALLPLLGWAQRDPLGHSAGLNLYEYASSRPTGETDSSGLFIRAALNKACEFLTSKGLACFCGLVEFGDLVANFIPNPVVGLVAAGLDCLCDIADILAQACYCAKSGLGAGIIISLIGAAASCIWNALTIDWGKIKTDIWKFTQFFGDLATSEISWIGAEMTPGNIPGLKACFT